MPTSLASTTYGGASEYIRHAAAKNKELEVTFLYPENAAANEIILSPRENTKVCQYHLSNLSLTDVFSQVIGMDLPTNLTLLIGIKCTKLKPRTLLAPSSCSTPSSTFLTNKHQQRLEDEEPARQVLDRGHSRTERVQEDDPPLLAPLLIMPVRSPRQGSRGIRTDSNDTFETTSTSPSSY